EGPGQGSSLSVFPLGEADPLHGDGADDELVGVGLGDRRQVEMHVLSLHAPARATHPPRYHAGFSRGYLLQQGHDRNKMSGAAALALSPWGGVVVAALPARPRRAIAAVAQLDRDPAHR